MKILVQCNYDPENTGGIEMVTRNLLDVLKTRGIAIEVIASSDIDILQYREKYVYRGFKIIRKISGAPLLLWGNLRFTLAAKRADLIIFQEPFPTLLPALFVLRFILRKRIIVVVHAIPHMPRFLAVVYDFLRRTLLSRVSVVATSPVLLEQLRLTGDASRAVIPLCFDETGALADKFCNERALTLPALPERYMLFFGRLAGYKGLEILMPTIRATPEVQFVIAGSGPKSKYIADFISLHKLKNLIFINRQLDDAEKFYLISNCSAFILPSTSSSEAFAIVQLEAMYFGRPIINTQLNNGVNYVAPEGVAALTVPVNNSDALVEAVRQLWFNPKLAQKLGLGGRYRFRKLFSRDAFLKAWNDYFNLIDKEIRSDN